MKTTAGVLAALALLGGAAMAQTTTDGATEGAEETTTAPAGTAPAGEEATGADAPLLLQEGEAAEDAGAEGTDADEADPIETDVEAEGEALEMDGTVPVDSSPAADPAEDGPATDATEGGTASGEAMDTEAGDVATDAEAEGDALIMDGTAPADASPEAEDDAAAPMEEAEED